MPVNSSPTASEYYLVPFGREPGGLLELLELPPDTPATEVSRREGEYRTKLDARLREAIKGLKARCDAGTLTKPEYDERRKNLEDEKTRSLAELNERKGKYDRTLAERRKLAKEGRPADPTTWQEAFPPPPSGGAAGVYEFLTAPRPLGCLGDDLVAEIIARWVRPQDRAFQALPSVRVPAAGPLSIADVVALAAERDAAVLLTADALWAELPHTNAARWAEAIAGWTAEAETDRVAFTPTATGDPRLPQHPDFPALCRVPRRSIDRLDAEAAEDLRQPIRSGADELGDLLAKLARRTRPAGDTGNRFEVNEDILGLLAELAAQAEARGPARKEST